jgi:hypothetical protein
MCAGAQRKVPPTQGCHFGQPQASLESRQQEGVVAPSTPGLLIGRGQESLDFWPSQEAHQRASLSFVRDGEHALDLGGAGGLLVSGVAKEGTNGSQTQIAAAANIAAALL